MCEKWESLKNPKLDWNIEKIMQVCCKNMMQNSHVAIDSVSVSVSTGSTWSPAQLLLQRAMAAGHQALKLAELRKEKIYKNRRQVFSLYRCLFLVCIFQDNCLYVVRLEVTLAVVYLR